MVPAYNKLRVLLFFLLTLIFVALVTQFGLNGLVNIMPAVERIGQSYYPFVIHEKTSSMLTTTAPISITEFVPKTPLEKRVYVRSAFLVNDTEIRVTIIKHFKNK